eukprot:3515323-Amphidinium_carterae.1
MARDDMFLVHSAMYGVREAPALWEKERNKKSRSETMRAPKFLLSMGFALSTHALCSNNFNSEH